MEVLVSFLRVVSHHQPRVEVYLVPILLLKIKVDYLAQAQLLKVQVGFSETALPLVKIKMQLVASLLAPQPKLKVIAYLATPKLVPVVDLFSEIPVPIPKEVVPSSAAALPKIPTEVHSSAAAAPPTPNLLLVAAPSSPTPVRVPKAVAHPCSVQNLPNLQQAAVFLANPLKK